MPSSTTEKNGCLKVDGNIKPTNSLNVKKSLSLFVLFEDLLRKATSRTLVKVAITQKTKTESVKLFLIYSKEQTQ